jgi:hypothetical protein
MTVVLTHPEKFHKIHVTNTLFIYKGTYKNIVIKRKRKKYYRVNL